MINHDIRVPTNQPGFFNGSTYPGRFFSKKNLRLGNLGSHGYNTSLSCHWTNRLALDIGKNQIQVLLNLFSSWWLGSHQPQVKNMAWLSKWVGENLPQSSG